MPNRTPRASDYQTEELQFISDNRELPLAELTERFNERFGERYKRTKKGIDGIKKRYGWLTGRTGKFYKGQVGKPKGGHVKGKSYDCHFKKGHVPENARPVGTIRDGRDGKYIKVANGRKCWMPLKNKVWIDHYGAIPKGMVVKVIDGDMNNCDINNLALISRAELMLINNEIKRHKIESPETMYALGMIKSKVKQQEQP